MPVAEPHRELRFTRAAQAIPFWIGGAICGAATIVLIIISTYRGENPELPHPVWAIIPLTLCYLCIRVALHCTKHAYLILSPLGLEVIPLIKPEKHMRLIYWGEIDSFEMGESLLTLHFDSEQKGGVHLELAPIPKVKLPLLKEALEGRIKSDN